MKFLFPLAVAVGLALGIAALLTGCDTFKHRSEEKSATFDSLSTATQKRLERGKINVGDTQDMVYIALGHPDETRSVQAQPGQIGRAVKAVTTLVIFPGETCGQLCRRPRVSKSRKSAECWATCHPTVAKNLNLIYYDTIYSRRTGKLG